MPDLNPHLCLIAHYLSSRRKADHEAANAERKLTPAQKKEKTARKLKEDTTAGVNVAVYRCIRLSGFLKGTVHRFFMGVH